MSNDISQHSVRNLLSGEVNYLIPMYQRNYAWGEGEITQLIQDVLDEMLNGSSENSKPYYIGSLVVFKKNNASEYPVYEVIDGQQRLTTLYLLACYFRNQERDADKNEFWFSRSECLSFESRPNSSNTLKAVFNNQISNAEDLPENFNVDILNGYKLVQELVPKLCQDAGNVKQSDLAQYLFENVQIMRVQVPEDTDLNHYFEIMNNRGEQLEKHEVLKSRLMSKLDKADYPVLHKVWEACANMERYVQMAFIPSHRDEIFGAENWGEFRVKNYDELQEVFADVKTNSDGHNALKINEIIQSSATSEAYKLENQSNKEEITERFNTVINFPNFLLQVLRVTSGEDIPLDDKRLINVFDDYLIKKEDAEARVKSFIYDLLKCKFLFDQYIIKREFTATDDRWSLKRLKWQSSNKSNDYVNTFGDEDQEGGDNRRVLMLLAALHISTPTMVYKHWLNGALRYLFTTYNENYGVNYWGYIQHLESMTRSFVFNRFLAKNDGLDYYTIIYNNNSVVQKTDIDESKTNFGKIENNLLFNYLDYLLWLRYREEGDVRNYDFTFRSSVEHFYPQNPVQGFEKLPEADLNSFGNLCLISHSKNSRLSNLSPVAKRDHYKNGDIDSIKQWLMMKKVDETKKWFRDEIAEHEKEMLAVLLSGDSK